MSILDLRLSVTVWWVADKMSTIFSREFVSINTLQPQVLHTRSFSCQNKKESIFLLLVMAAGKGKCIIYTNACTRDVWKCSRELCFQLYLQKKSVIINFFLRLFFSFFEKGHLETVFFFFKERKSPIKDLFSNFHFKTPFPSPAEENLYISVHWFGENWIVQKSTVSPPDTKGWDTTHIIQWVF